MGVVRRDGIGYFDSYVKKRAIGDQFATLAVGFHDRCQDTLKRKAISGVGKHDQRDGIAMRRDVASKAVVEIGAHHDIGTIAT